MVWLDLISRIGSFFIRELKLVIVSLNRNGLMDVIFILFYLVFFEDKKHFNLIFTYNIYLMFKNNI